MTIARPITPAVASFYVPAQLITSPVISLTYTLFDPEGDPVGEIAAQYSLNGGGQWNTAVPTKTITQNLATGRLIARAHTMSQTIPANATSPIQVNLHITEELQLAGVVAWLNITHTNNAELELMLQSPQGTRVPLVALGDAQKANFQGTRFATSATTNIPSSTAPYSGTHQPAGNLTSFIGQESSGMWSLIITNTSTSTGTLAGWGLQLTSPPVRHVYHWDTFASGFFGQSDNVVVRMVAYSQPLSTTVSITGSYGYTNTAPGPIQRPYASATTFPFRVRGTQMRILNENGEPAEGAMVYRLQKDQFTGARPISDGTGTPYRTNAQGYLQGRGTLEEGDQLVALLPVTSTHTFTASDMLDPLPEPLPFVLYHTSATPTENGLDMHEVSREGGVQTLTVSDDNPLLLFNLDLSLEWDARNDGLFMQELDNALQRASEVLYDATNGQAALGDITVHQAKERWMGADIVLYARNDMRPRANTGGIVITRTQDIFWTSSEISETKPNAYLPGHIRMGPIWDPFGQSQAELTQDWWRTLAHELAHYLFFLPDNYLGIEGGAIRQIDCHGSFMTNSYDADYGEFLDRHSHVWQKRSVQTISRGQDNKTLRLADNYPFLSRPYCTFTTDYDVRWHHHDTGH